MLGSIWFRKKLKAFGWCNESFATCDQLVKIQSTTQLFGVSFNTNNTRVHCIRVPCECVYECTHNSTTHRCVWNRKKGRKSRNSSNQKDTVANAKVSRLIYNNLQTCFFFLFTRLQCSTKQRVKGNAERKTGWKYDNNKIIFWCSLVLHVTTNNSWIRNLWINKFSFVLLSMYTLKS